VPKKYYRMCINDSFKHTKDMEGRIMNRNQKSPYCPFSVMGPCTRCDQGVPFREPYPNTDNPDNVECLAYLVAKDPFGVTKWGCRRLVKI
jgi:hypothetical protein